MSRRRRSRKARRRFRMMQEAMVQANSKPQEVYIFFNLETGEETVEPTDPVEAVFDF